METWSYTPLESYNGIYLEGEFIGMVLIFVPFPLFQLISTQEMVHYTHTHTHTHRSHTHTHTHTHKIHKVPHNLLSRERETHRCFTLHCSLEAGEGRVQPDEVVTGGRLRSAVKSGDCAAVQENFDLSVSHAALLAHDVVQSDEGVILYQPFPPDPIQRVNLLTPNPNTLSS